jgi:pimeloyl-ACP methyl ester carboxylesterase
VKKAVGLVVSSVLGSLLVFLLLGVSAGAAQASCFVAFVHGSGEDHHDEPAGAEAINRYWSSDGSSASSMLDGLARTSGCFVWRIGYDGNQQWWSDRAAGKVAASLHDFIDAFAIPDGGLTLIGHSMGGLVVRYVVNSGSPAAPYYNEYTWMNDRMDYDLVRRKTGRVIALQSPLTGAQSADALFGKADHRLTNAGADVIKILGWRGITNATGVMSRPYMEAAGSPGGEMGDEGREVPLYTVGSYALEDGSGIGMDDDDKLDAAWGLLCYKRAAVNSWGAGCRWDVWNFQSTAGDGLVERSSAHGLWMRGNPTGTGGILGARRAWLDVLHNHNQGRYDALSAEIRNLISAETRVARLGSYMGDHLP